MNKLSVIAAVVTMSFAAPAVAVPVDTGVQRAAVSTAGLVLSTPKGQRLLDLRILHAASSLCATPSAADALGAKRFKRCREAAQASADAQRRERLVAAGRTAKAALASAK